MQDTESDKQNSAITKTMFLETPTRKLIGPFVWLILVFIMLMNVIMLKSDPLSFFRMKEGTDFNSVYYASERQLLGDNIYFPQDQKYFFTNEYGLGRYTYPPLTSYAYIPFTLFGYSSAFKVYSYLSLLMLAFIFFLMSGITKEKKRYFLYFLPFLFSFAFWAHIERGQFYLPVMVCLVLLYYFFLQQKEIFSGILLGLAISLKVTPAIFLFYFLIRNRKIFFYAVLFSLILIVLTGISSNFEFLRKFAELSDVYSAGRLNNGLFYVLGAYSSYLHIPYATNKHFIDLVIFVLSLYFFSIFYKKTTALNPFTTLYEFGVLSSLMILIPHISYIYNGVLVLFIFLFYAKVRSKDYLSLNQILLLDAAFLFFLAPVNVFSWVWLQSILILRPVMLVLILLILKGPYDKIALKFNRVSAG